MEAPSRMEFKIKGRRKLYVLAYRRPFLKKENALKKAAEMRKEGYKSRVKNIKGKYFIYYFN